MKPTLAAHGGLWLATLAPATAVALTPGAAATARSALNFPLQPAPPSLNEAAQIALTNARVAGAIIVCAYAVARCPAARRLLDPLLVAVVVTNAALVGIALGAYGRAALPWLIHLPLEWTALAMALTRYLSARRDSVSLIVLGRTGAIVAVVVAVAATMEVVLTPRP